MSRIKELQAKLAQQKGGANLVKNLGKKAPPKLKKKASNEARKSLDNSASLKKPTQIKRRRKKKNKKFNIVRLL